MWKLLTGFMVVLLLVACPTGSSTTKRSTSRSVYSPLRVARGRCTAATTAATVARCQHPFFVSPSRRGTALTRPSATSSGNSSSGTRCNSSRGSSSLGSLSAGTFSAAAPQGPLEASPYHLLGGGLVLPPSLVFALAARRLLQQELHRQQQAAASAVYTPITIEGGRGGDGSVAFLRLRAAPRSGAAGGSGGCGGCVLLTAVGGPHGPSGAPKATALLGNAARGSWKAEAGGTGGGQSKQGANGEDLLLGLPPNTLAIDVSPLQFSAADCMKRLQQQQLSGEGEEETSDQWHENLQQRQQQEPKQKQQQQQQKQRQQEQQQLCCIYFSSLGETVVAARGGVGGRGNAAFVSNHNRHPLVGEVGAPGEKKKLLLLPNFADFLAIGSVQSGKSTLLRALAAAAAAAVKTGDSAVTEVAAAAVAANGGEAANAAALPQQHKMAIDEAARMQHDWQQQQQQRSMWLSAAVPSEVWVPTTEPVVAIIPAPQQPQQQQQQQQNQQQQQQQQMDGLLQVLQRSLELSETAPIVALDTPGLVLPPVVGAAATEAAAAAAAARAEEMGDLLLPPAAPDDSPLHSLSAATGVLFVIDGSHPDPADEFRRLKQQLQQQNSQLAELPAFLILNKIDRLHQQQQQQHESQQITELMERVKRQTGLAEVYAVSALQGDGCLQLLAALRRASGLGHLSTHQQQKLLSHYQRQQQQQQQQLLLQGVDAGAHRLAFLTAYAAAAGALGFRSLLLFTARELRQQQHVPGAALLHRPAAAPPLRIASSRKKQHQHPSFPSLENPYKWQLVEIGGETTLQRMLQSHEVLQAAPGFASQDSKASRCFELRGPLLSLLAEPVKFNTEDAKLRLYRQLSALGIIQRLFDEFGAAVGDYLSVGSVLLQLLPLPLMRYPKRKKKSRQLHTQQQQQAAYLWEILKTDGIPAKKNSGSAAAAATAGKQRLLDFEETPSVIPSVRPFTAVDHRAVRERRRTLKRFCKDTQVLPRL